MPTSTAPPPGRVLDLPAMLDPGSGLARGHSIEPPSLGGDGLWRVTVRLQCPHEDGPDPRQAPEAAQLRTCVTGACSLTRAEAMVRAVGESVERIALHPGPGIVATSARVGERALDLAGAGSALAAPPSDLPLRWYAARRPRDGASLLVPAPLVDYPGDPVPGFDPGPSGTGAGLGPDAALRSALLETVERDAVITSWARRLRTRAIDLDRLLAGSAPGPGWARVSRLVDVVRRAGLTPDLAELPLSVPGLVGVVGGVRAETPTGPVTCLGSKVSDDPARAVAGAVEESLQLHRGLLALRSSGRAADPPAVVTGENDRLRFLASDAGQAALADFLADPTPADYPTSLPPLDIDDLLAAVLADGLDPLVVDLGDRLPERVRAAGWSVVSVVPVGYQPLRIDERTAFGWDVRRLETLEARTGATARLPAGVRNPAPHPLP